MNIVQEIEKKYRDNPKHGVTFSIDPSAYECSIGDRISFGENYSHQESGAMYNWQNVYLDMAGNTIGYLEERCSGKLLDPMCVSFCVFLADCMDSETWSEMETKYADNPHLSDIGEVLRLEFATLQQLVEFVFRERNLSLCG